MNFTFFTVSGWCDGVFWLLSEAALTSSCFSESWIANVLPLIILKLFSRFSSLTFALVPGFGGLGFSINILNKWLRLSIINCQITVDCCFGCY